MNASLADVQQRIPIARWQVADVNFAVANQDTVVPHTLNSLAVHYLVTDRTGTGVVFRGTKAPQLNYLVLQASVIGTYHLLLFVEVTQ